MCFEVLTRISIRNYTVNMCGRVVVDYEEVIPGAADTALASWITVQPAGAESTFNLKPTEQLPIAFTDIRTGEARFETAFWSLAAPWAKELKPQYPTFNARSETVAEKRTFAPALKNARCAIPVSAFYEWTGPKNTRVPHAIFGPEPVLPLAGLFSWWHEPGTNARDGWHLTATILTQASDGAMSDLHHRMPVFLSEELIHDWLNPSVFGTDLLPAVIETSRALSFDLREYAVAPLRGNGPELLQPK